MSTGAQTKFRSLTNSELLRHVTSSEAHRSPLIQELCTRLQEHEDVERKLSVPPDEYTADCPVCEANLTISVGHDTISINI